MGQVRLDRIRNGNFAAGRLAPRSWQWQALSGRARWRWGVQGANGDGRRLILETGSARSAGQWSQSFRCRSGHRYRLEVRGACRAWGEGQRGGLSVRVRCFDRKGKVLGGEQCYGPWRSREPTWWRVQQRTPGGASKLEISVRLEGVRGVAELDRVRAIPMDYVCTEAHPLAVPPWPCRHHRPLRVRRVEIVDGVERGGRLAGILRARFGARNVRVKPPGGAARWAGGAEALIVSTNGDLPKAWTWDAVLRRAQGRIIVLSLPAFEQLANRKVAGCVRVREHRQDDDPLGAKVEQANFITNGFALQDVFDFAVFDEAAGGFRQRQVVRSVELRRFLESQALQTILSSDTNMDQSSGRPICLYKEMPGGGIVVLDCEPLLSPMTNDHAGNAAIQLLMNILGADTVSLGQLADPGLSEEMLLEQLRSLARQFPGVSMRWTEWGVGSGRGGPQPVLSVGPDGAQSRMLRLPGVVVRTGLDQGGRLGIEGASNWLKSLVRPEPCACRYAAALLQRRQVLWVPWGRRLSGEQLRRLADLSQASLLVDVLGTDRNVMRVVVPRRRGGYERYFAWLPALDEQFRMGRMFGWLPAAGAELNDGDAYAWRSDKTPLEVVAEGKGFGGDGVSLPPGAQRVRVEVPAADPASAADSILETERLGLLLEWIAGLEIGVVAVNRDPVERRISLPATGTWSRARTIEANGQADELKPGQVGRAGRSSAVLAPGATLVLERAMD